MLAAMFRGMTEEQIVHRIAADQQQSFMEMQQIKQAMDAFKAAGGAGAKGGGAKGGGDDWPMGKGAWYEGGSGRVVLDAKHFRRCDNFEGNPAMFKSWMFDLLTAVRSVDQSLSRDLRVQLKDRPKVEVSDGKFDIRFEIDLKQSCKV